MICPNCSRMNPEGAKNCGVCGAPMPYVAPRKEKDEGSIFILVWAAILIICAIGKKWLYLSEFGDGRFDDTDVTILFILNMIHDISMILPVFAVKQKTLKIITFVLIGIYILWMVYTNVTDLIHNLDYIRLQRSWGY